LSVSDRAEAVRGLETELGVLIRRVRRVAKERAVAVHPDLQALGAIMLAWLVDNGQVRASAIVDVFAIDKGALSRQLGQLEELGLVERVPDPADGRATLVSVSEEGRRRLAHVEADRRALLDQRLHDWSATELEQFVAQLSRYNTSLGR
jgi:DNA-binding MarR family transcriptional regulator